MQLKRFLSNTALLCGMAIVLGCSDSEPEIDGANIAYLNLEQQQQHLSKSSSQVVDLMDNTKTQDFENYLNRQSDYQLDVSRLTTSITKKPLLLTKYATIAKSLKNKTFKGSSVNFSVDYNLKPSSNNPINSNYYMVTDFSLSGQSCHTANLSLAGRTTSVIFTISDQMVNINEDKRAPKSVDWKLKHQGSFLYGLKYRINRFDLSSTGTMIDIEASGTMEDVENLITLKVERATGLHASFTTVSHGQTLLGFNFDINTNLSSIEKFNTNYLIAWAIDSEKHKTIELNTTLMNGEVTSCARTVDPFDKDEKVIVGDVLADIGHDTIVNAERLGIIFDHLRPYTTQNIYFQGIDNSQASVLMVTQEQLETLDYPRLISDAKRVINLIDTIGKAELTDLAGVIESDSTLLTSVLEDIDAIDGMLYDLPVVIHSENFASEDTITIRQYWQNSGISEVKDRYKSMTYSVIEPFINRKKPLIKNQDELIGFISWINDNLLK